MPTFDVSAPEVAFVSFGAQPIARRVASTAMGQSLNQVRTPVQLGAKGGIGLELPRPEKHELPAGDQRALGPGEGQRIGRCLSPYRLACHEERVKRARIVIRKLGEMIVGEGGI